MIAGALDGACRDVVAAARQAWRGRLIDVSRRNNLLYFRHLKVGTVDLGPVAERLAPLLAEVADGEEPSVLLRHLFDADTLPTAAGKLQEIRRRAQANYEERGLETLHLVLGFATWTPDDEGSAPSAPVLLMPVKIEEGGRDGRSLSLCRAGDAVPNLVLLHALERGFNVTVSAEDLTDLAEGEEDDEGLDLDGVFEHLRNAARDVPGFVITPGFALGNFAFQKLAMVAELDALGDRLAAHELIGALAGCQPAREAVQARRSDIGAETLDVIRPDEEFLVCDADSSQQRAVRCALAGQSGVISGPPGTGKSQTIVNLVAELAGSGKRVLFVAEKRAALDVVLDRLGELGLGHLCLDLHGADVKRRDVAERVAAGLSLIRSATRVDVSTCHQEFEAKRARLNGHARRLHERHHPWDVSAFELQGDVLAANPDVRSGIRWRAGRGLEKIDRHVARQVEELLVDLAGLHDLFLGTNPSPWTAATFDEASDAQQALDIVTDLVEHDWPAFADAVRAAEAHLTERRLRSLDDADKVVEVLGDAARPLEFFEDGVFERRLQDDAAALEPGTGAFSHLWALLTNESYRRSRSALKALSRDPAPPRSALLEAARLAATVQDRWSGLDLPGRPRLIDPWASLHAAATKVRSPFEVLARWLPECDVRSLAIDDVGGWITALAADRTTPFRVVRMRQIVSRLSELVGPTFATELRKIKKAPGTWPEVFRYAWRQSCLEEILAKHPELAAFDGRTHERFVDDFRSRDRERVALAVHRVRVAHADMLIATCNAHRDQESLVRQEANKKRRHLPVRELVARAPDVLGALFPCWLASPLSVSQLLPARKLFDVVLFDEASQVLPEDAVPALFRASQAVVAGDQRQLPPTTFFSAQDEGDERDVEEVSGYESILDSFCTFLAPEWHLDWHYRSRDEALIAFSNHHIYARRLVTFPGAGQEPAIEHVLVEHDGSDTDEESVGAEVRRIVDLVAAHAESRPDETLGVIAMGIAHARRIEAAIDRLRQERTDLAEFFDEQRHERFFVKNLERVQGDERDAIILSVGYGKDRSGKLPYRFGPLLQEGGERRLNVAITRARRRMTVVSSFSHLDMDPGRSSRRGVQLLRAYLEYAASGGRNLGRDTMTTEPLNAFEQHVYDALLQRDIPLLPQYGASRFRIDLAAQHPEKPGRLVLAIECDGATYHSAPTARDRDRLRQQHLEALGWRFHRIWSTDWFLRPDAEIERAWRAYADAVAYADRVDREGGPPVSHPPAPTAAPAPEPRPIDAGPRPAVPPGLGIDKYSNGALVSIAAWLLRVHFRATDSELLPYLMDELGFERRGGKIVLRLEAAIRQARANVAGIA
jgi:very-short-patch-repair endonuclease